MITTVQLVEALARNVRLAHMQAAGLSHADSLRQPPFRGNCLNWILGHLASNRDRMLQTLGAAPVMGEAGQRYVRESEPITADGPGALPLEELLRLLAASQDALAAVLAGCTDDQLAQNVQSGERTTTVAERVFFLYFHETYHIGQTELLRQLAGKDDQII